MTASYESFGRTNQKTRTRAAIKAAAVELMKNGETPSMTQIAEAAIVSKSTAYRYFPSQEVLIAEIMLDAALGEDLEAVYTAAKTQGTPAARLAAVIQTDHTIVIKHENAFRKLLRVVLTSYADDIFEIPRRPGNRLRYLAEALAPLKGQFDGEQFERLVMALSLCVGVESIVVMKDVCGLKPEEAERTKLWAANALLQAMLQESGFAKHDG